MLERAGDLEQRGTGFRGTRKADAELNPFEQDVQAPRAGVQHACGLRHLRQVRDRGGGILGRGEDFEIADRVLPPAERARGHHPLDVRLLPQALDHRLDQRHRAAERNSWNRLPQCWQGGGHCCFRRVVEARHRSDGSPRHGGAELRRARGAHVLVNGGELRHRHGARLEQPAEISGEIGDRGLEQHPGAGLVHVTQTLAQLRIAVEGQRRIHDRAEIGVRADAALAHEQRAGVQHRRLPLVSANRREQREIGQRLVKGRV